jgi:hypothetical protein
LFQRDKVDLKLYRFENPKLFGKLFLIYEELHRIEPDGEGKGVLKKKANMKEIKNVRSLGITFLSFCLGRAALLSILFALRRRRLVPAY